MNWFDAIILGIVQGVTEWFPVSSSGHLVLFTKILRLEQDIFFDVILHLASLVVLVIFFWKDIQRIFTALFSFKNKSPDFKLAAYIMIASIPIAIIGIIFYDTIAAVFESLFYVSIAFIATGILLFLTKYFNGNKNLNFLNTFFIGAMQAVALLPGVSRSGSTISAGLILGVKKEEAARFSFLLAIPAIAGAVFFEFIRFDMGAIELKYILLGFISSLVIGYLSLSFLIKVISKGKLHYFSYYCFVVGTVSLIISMLRL